MYVYPQELHWIFLDCSVITHKTGNSKASSLDCLLKFLSLSVIVVVVLFLSCG